MLSKKVLRVGAALSLATMTAPAYALRVPDSVKSTTNHVQHYEISTPVNDISEKYRLSLNGTPLTTDDAEKERIERRERNMKYLLIAALIAAVALGNKEGPPAVRPPGPHPELTGCYDYAGWPSMNSQAPITAKDGMLRLNLYETRF
jgi:hypothetical protein